jgi:hypothetical protein
MKQQEVFNKIGGIIKELSEQYEYLKATEEPLNDLELELFLANSHFLTDHMVILSKLNAQQASAAQKETEKKPEPVQPKRTTTPEPPKNTQEPKYFEPLVQSVPAPKNGVATPETKADDKQAEAEDITLKYIEPVNDETPDTIRHELIIDEADLDEDDEFTDEPVAEIEEETLPMEIPAPEVPVVVKETETPAEQPAPKQAEESLKEHVPTINERISAQMAEKNGAAEQINMQPISDLKAAINMNDKLLYVKDLFNGYSLAYSEAIEILNRFSNFEEADLFLKKNYVAKNHWDSKPETTDKFYTVLRRRYA